MRYYLKNDEHEFVIDLIKTRKISQHLICFEFFFFNEASLRQEKKEVYIRKLANQYFSSEDGKTWNKLAKQILPDMLLSINEYFKVFYGFLPSSLMSNEEGGLYTKMPGKVVKIFVNVGNEVKKGQTLLVLEAMKMENEIKCHRDGIVKAIHAVEGQILEQGILLMEVES